MHDIMDDIEEQKEVGDEIAEAISRPNGSQDYDEVCVFVANCLLRV